jgi:hypothetical protein
MKFETVQPEPGSGGHGGIRDEQGSKRRRSQRFQLAHARVRALENCLRRQFFAQHADAGLPYRDGIKPLASNCRITRPAYLSTTTPGNSSASLKQSRQASFLLIEQRSAPGDGFSQPCEQSEPFCSLIASRETSRSAIFEEGL